MKTELREKEEELLSQLEDYGRLGEDIEKGMLKFLFLKIMREKSDLEKSEIRDIYHKYEEKVDNRYKETQFLSGEEMKTWLLGLFTSLDMVRINLDLERKDRSSMMDLIDQTFSEEELDSNISKWEEKDTYPIINTKLIKKEIRSRRGNWSYSVPNIDIPVEDRPEKVVMTQNRTKFNQPHNVYSS